MTFAIKDLLWVTALVAVSICWYRDHNEAFRFAEQNRVLERELVTNRRLVSVLGDMNVVTNYTKESGIAVPMPLYKRIDSRDVTRLLLAKSDCVILGEVEEEAQSFLTHEANSHMSGRMKVRILDVAKGKGLPVGELISLGMDGIPEIFPRKGEKKVFLVELTSSDLNTLSTDDIRYCVLPGGLFSEFKSEAEAMRNRPKF